MRKALSILLTLALVAAVGAGCSDYDLGPEVERAQEGTAADAVSDGDTAVAVISGATLGGEQFVANESTVVYDSVTRTLMIPMSEVFTLPAEDDAEVVITRSFTVQIGNYVHATYGGQNLTMLGPVTATTEDILAGTAEEQIEQYTGSLAPPTVVATFAEGLAAEAAVPTADCTGTVVIDQLVVEAGALPGEADEVTVAGGFEAEACVFPGGDGVHTSLTGGSFSIDLSD